MAYDRKYDVRYPSGKTFTATGVFKLIPIERYLTPCVVPTLTNRVFMLDPRAVVSWGDKVVYQPRTNLDGLSVEMRDWLDQHPEWPPKKEPTDAA